MQTKSTTVYWCLGSNIDPEQHIGFAVRQFQKDFRQLKLSKLYSCPAVGFDGDDFLNLALSTCTTQTLPELLEYANHLEQSAGRVRVRRGRFDSRTLDVDLIMYGQLQGLHQGRIWPSEDIDEAAHVLRPMLDIAANERHPVTGKRFSSLWQEFDETAAQLTQVDKIW